MRQDTWVELSVLEVQWKVTEWNGEKSTEDMNKEYIFKELYTKL